MRRIIRLGVLTLGLLLLSTAPLSASLVVFSDGLTHAIPGDVAFADGDAISLSAASGLIVASPASVSGVAGATGPQSSAGAALVSALGTSVEIRESTVTGGFADAASPNINPGPQVQATGGAAIDLGGSLFVSNGSLIGGSAVASAKPTVALARADGGEALVVASGIATIGQGLFRSGGATSGGSRTQNTARSGDVHVLEAGSTLVIDGGSHESGPAIADDSTQSRGDSLAESGHLLSLHAGSTAVVHGGTFRSGHTTAISGTVGNASGANGAWVRADDGTRVALYGGDYAPGGGLLAASGTRTQANASSIRLEVTGSDLPTRITVLGGNDIALDIPFTAASTPDARVTLVAGASGSLHLAHPQVTTVIVGQAFAMNGALIAPGPVAATSGTISRFGAGVFATFTFERSNGAPLVLPEPAHPIGLALIALVLFAQRRPNHSEA